MSIEDLLNETGGMGRFQVALIACLLFNKFIIAWSMLQMSFAGFIPNWYCLGFSQSRPINETLNACFIDANKSVRCERYQFIGESWTIANEWNLVCDLKWVKVTVTSIQMAGVLVGSLISGQLGDYLGRKKTAYFFVIQHSVTNIITAFSVNWQMFAVCRFFIGLGIGSVIVAVFPYSLEFLPKKWRPVLAIIPAWCLGISAFALAALILQNWSHIHLACGVFGLAGLAGYFFVPESLRWLTIHGRVQEAEKVVAQIAQFNKKTVPTKTSIILQNAAEEEKRIRESGQKYTYMDLFRGWKMTKITLIFCYHCTERRYNLWSFALLFVSPAVMAPKVSNHYNHKIIIETAEVVNLLFVASGLKFSLHVWAVLSCVYYGIVFGVTSLSGNIQLNIFLLNIIELPATVLTFFLNNRIGRKWAGVIFMGLPVLAAFACPIVLLYVQSGLKTNIITGLCLAAKMGIGASWSIIQTWGNELYPTVTRNLGFGAANAASRIGGILAPFVIDFDSWMVESYFVIGCLCLVSVLLMFFTPETMGAELADSFKHVVHVRNDNNSKTMENKDEHVNDSLDDTVNKHNTRL